MNAFDELLESIADGDRKALADIGQKYPQLRESVLRQSDYTKKMNDLKPIEAYAQKWEEWADKNWSSEHNVTKAEHARNQKIAELEAQLAKNGNEGDQVTFDQLNEAVKKQMAEAGIVTKGDIASHVDPIHKTIKTETEGQMNLITRLFTQTVPLVMQHKDEFGEVLDIDDMFSTAQKAGINDVKMAYSHYTAEKRAAKDKAAVEAAKSEAYQKGKLEGQQERVMGEDRMPVDMSGPSMGHLERQLFQQKTEEERAQQVVPDTVPLGNGVGRFVAQAYRKGVADKLAAQ